jgi:hypothetical protein
MRPETVPGKTRLALSAVWKAFLDLIRRNILVFTEPNPNPNIECGMTKKS